MVVNVVWSVTSDRLVGSSIRFTNQLYNSDLYPLPVQFGSQDAVDVSCLKESWWRRIWSTERFLDDFPVSKVLAIEYSEIVVPEVKVTSRSNYLQCNILYVNLNLLNKVMAEIWQTKIQEM